MKLYLRAQQGMLRQVSCCDGSYSMDTTSCLSHVAVDEIDHKLNTESTSNFVYALTTPNALTAYFVTFENVLSYFRKTLDLLFNQSSVI